MDTRAGATDKAEQAMPWRLLALLMAMTAIGPATLNMIVPALPGLTTRLDTDTGTVQLTLSLFLLSLATAQLLLGPLSDRFGRRPVVLGGVAITVLASLAGIAASSIHALIAVRIVQAVGAATGIVMGRAIIRDLFERDRAAAMIGLVTTAMVIAPMVSVPPTVHAAPEVTSRLEKFRKSLSACPDPCRISAAVAPAAVLPRAGPCSSDPVCSISTSAPTPSNSTDAAPLIRPAFVTVSAPPNISTPRRTPVMVPLA